MALAAVGWVGAELVAARRVPAERRGRWVLQPEVVRAREPAPASELVPQREAPAVRYLAPSPSAQRAREPRTCQQRQPSDATHDGTERSLRIDVASRQPFACSRTRRFERGLDISERWGLQAVVSRRGAKSLRAKRPEARFPPNQHSSGHTAARLACGYGADGAGMVSSGNTGSLRGVAGSARGGGTGRGWLRRWTSCARVLRSSFHRTRRS